MTRHEMINALDQEIHRLERARTLLRHPRTATNGAATGEVYARPIVKRTISPEGRRRIIEAQRRRWAKQKKEASAKA